MLSRQEIVRASKQRPYRNVDADIVIERGSGNALKNEECANRRRRLLTGLSVDYTLVSSGPLRQHAADRYVKTCGTNRLALSVTSDADSRMPMPADCPSITQLPMTG